jgi:nucleoside-diphosphate-sugar epimerase
MNGVTLLTGGTGFVGRQVLRALGEKGVRVRMVVRDGKQNQLAILDSVESVVTTLDLFAEDANWWADACDGIDTVIHVAWYAEPGQYLQSSKNLDCLMGTLQLAKGAVQAGVRRFVGVGTCFEYEISNCMLSVHAPLAPSTPYASAKAAAFLALSQYLPSVGMEKARMHDGW